MSLESIIETYGWNDYLDVHTGNIYQLSEAMNNGDGTSEVPIIGNTGYFIGFCKVNVVMGV